MATCYMSSNVIVVGSCWATAFLRSPGREALKHLEKLQHVVGRVIGPLLRRVLQQTHVSEPLSVGGWFWSFVVVGGVALLDDHHEVGDPGQQFSGSFVRSHGQIRKPFDYLLVIGLCRKLLLEPWLQIRPSELSVRPSSMSAVANSHSRAKPLKALATFA